MSAIRAFTFIGGDDGPWTVLRAATVVGEPLLPVPRIHVVEGLVTPETPAAWALRGVTSHERYVTRREHAILASRTPPLGRRAATRAALIPIRKSASWWALAQDTRREVLERSSRHIETGLEYLPAIARRLHHGRDLGEPFDFVTWFEYAPADAEAFEELVARLRKTEEWSYVEREVDLRLSR